jgi:hypothetical protein
MRFHPGCLVDNARWAVPALSAYLSNPCVPAHMANRHTQHRIIIAPDLILRESTGLKQR